MPSDPTIVHRPAGPLVRLAIEQVRVQFEAALERVIAAAAAELGLPPEAAFDMDQLTWRIPLPSVEP